jgi:hypothetical protein
MVAMANGCVLCEPRHTSTSLVRHIPVTMVTTVAVSSVRYVLRQKTQLSIQHVRQQNQMAELETGEIKT